MSFPIRTTLEDAFEVCKFLSRKPTGATPADARKILDSKYLDGRKISALKAWGLVEGGQDGRLKITDDGRAVAKDDQGRVTAYLGVIKRIAAYRAIVERVAHRKEQSISATDVGAHWHQHFSVDASDSDKILSDQAVCFFQLATGAGLGSLVVGRRGGVTRFEFSTDALAAFIDGQDMPTVQPRSASAVKSDSQEEEPAQKSQPPFGESLEAQANAAPSQLGQAIFVGHGKNKKPLDQLKRILEQFKIPYKVAIEEPNLGRPIGAKVCEVMESCNCAILIFTADEELQSANGKTIWRPSENVVFELGASGYLYGNRIVIMKEDDVDFPTNFRDLGYISFTKDQLEAKAMEVLKELIGFGIVKVST